MTPASGPARRGRAWALVVLLGVVSWGLSACVSAGPASSSVEPVASPSAGPVSSPSSPPATSEGAEAAFRAWLRASRTPDAGAACAALAPELSARMIAELNATGQMHVATCAEMISATAELYKALGQSADIHVDVQSETSTDATLFVTYTASGDCGTVVMHRPDAHWILTSQSKECAR